MKGSKKGFVFVLILVFFSSMMISASLTREIEPLPLWEKESAHEAQRIIVVSDLHLGVDDSFSETVKNKDLLTEFLERLVISDIDELVIAGDMLDEWFVPISYEPHNDLGAFFEKVAENNASIVAAFEKIIQSGVVVAYVPGNHDLLLDEETLAKLIPGIVQARDVDGLGTYRTGMRSEIVIEHGHRYDTFCAPDTLSNKEMTGDYPSFLPPGYFFTRIASTSVVEGKSAPDKNLPRIEAPSKEDADQLDAYTYYNIWLWAMTTFPIKADFDEKAIYVGVNGYDNSFSLSDLLPTVQDDGSISAVLYANAQRRWDEVQQNNRVAVKNPYSKATAGAIDHTFFDEQAVKQYFDLDPTVDVVVFGHSHVPLVNRYENEYDKEKVYANSGTWIDENLIGLERCFVVIESGKQFTDVRLMEYHADGTISNTEQK
ncbi:MAG TPA: metallophosphoesterase [Mesotoga sp.]|nr:metallophosphoesterase [Mesotoga sp.]MDD5744478.1 metallophosphoesterase [Mesotoga sp.]NLX33774.1 metallophosphoesterase [Thermotogaceae bacterium]HPM96235.1 metallophosphoesterase [Mesotoga sp.]HQC57453.1 metallophosphoesterase [Mesotoga sp.]